ncbi:LamG domain-containing protein [Patescibacteria group bacterium]|nr:LamG domain-containing protein [Patescibacteria group bacterium]
MNNEHEKEKRTEIFLEILIGVFIILILVSAYPKYLKPLLAELQGQKRDPIRIRQLSSINSAINNLRETNPRGVVELLLHYPPGPSLGEPNRVYISLPSPKLNCEGLELPSLPDDWEYRCKPETDYKKIDGQGWLPVDFTKLSAPPFKELPIDPINDAKNLNYYAFVGNEKSEWVLTVMLESKKYQKEKALTDNGTDPARFEIGSSPQLWAKPSGLVGYWKFDEGQGTTTADSSGNNNTGTLINGPKWTTGRGQTSTGGGLTSALSFDGINDYVRININLVSQEVTGCIWTKANGAPNEKKGQLNGAYNFHLWINPSGSFNYGAWTTSTNEEYTGSGIYSFNTWHFVCVVNKGASYTKLYVDGKLDSQTELIGNLINPTYFEIGRHPSNNGNYFNGSIDEVRIYNRVLNETEIRAIYNATK